MKNKIRLIESDAFRTLATTLKSLDLSYNSLDKIPENAFSRLTVLKWLNLYGNEISDIGTSNLLNLKASVSTLFLGGNDLKDIPPYFFNTFKNLTWLNLDHNHIFHIPDTCFPSTLITLSLSYNLINKFPSGAIANMPSLKWFTIRGNYIEQIPQIRFGSTKHLDKLDIGENFIVSLPENMFNGSVDVIDLNLDYNYVERIGPRVFKSLNARRIYLGFNRIEFIDDEAFEDVEDMIDLIDLESNKLLELPSALGRLRRLRYLYLQNNYISKIESPKIFDSFCSSLLAFSAAGNGLTEFPYTTLHNCKVLRHLNLGYNKIYHIKPEFFVWASKLDTLILRNNRLTQLGPHVFRDCTKLRELSLSFNDFQVLDSEAFTDIGTTLQSLEISFGLNGIKAFPHNALRPLQKLMWLAFDNNELSSAEDTSLYNAGDLQYLNLENNNLHDLPRNLLHKNVHSSLIDVRLAHNRISIIKTGTFVSLKELQTIDLSGNSIVILESTGFFNLKNLFTLILSHNYINQIDPKTFSNLLNLQKLDMSYNKLTKFEFDSFDNCTKHVNNPLHLDLSHNQIDYIQEAVFSKTASPIISELDVSYNILTRIPKEIFKSIVDHLKILNLSFNQISRIRKDDFIISTLNALKVQVLNLSHNNLRDLDKRCFDTLTGIQILYLNDNALEMLQFAQFSGLTGLRILDLHKNKLRSLPRDVFQFSSVETLDLSWNEFVALPTSALNEISSSLRYLNLSHNKIEHLDSTMFSNFPHLLSLSLASNKLTILPDNIFSGLGSLIILDLSYNAIRANLRELFHYVHRLRELRLAGSFLRELPSFTLPSLVKLDVSDNHLSDLPYNYLTVEDGLYRLKYLNLSGNDLIRLPARSWYYVPFLKSLDVSWNPLRVLTKESFYGLARLQILSVRNLVDLKRFDSDSLTQLTNIRRLFIQSWPTIEKFKFRLGSLVSGLSSLHYLSARIEEPSGVLTDQILGAFGPKLKELEITGDKLTEITLDSLEGIDSYELTLAIRHTNVSTLPIGFIQLFKNVFHLSLDIQNNSFRTLSPEVFYSNGSLWKYNGTNIIQGGLSLQNNPWLCSCENVWLGIWLRRWMREALQLHISPIENGINVRNMIRSIECIEEKPLTDLREDMQCVSGHASSISFSKKMISHADRCFVILNVLFLLLLSQWNFLY
ncbi:chaoptin [Lepeophtheirus salmonis]|nr:chaoptin-like [Lepeophtheirus salmonis]